MSIIKQLGLVGGPKRLLEAPGAVLPDFHQMLGQAAAALAADAVEALAQRGADRRRHRLA